MKTEEKRFKNAYDAHIWVNDHPKMNFQDIFSPWIELTPVLVNPKTKRIEDDSKENTLVNWWIEAGSYDAIIPFEGADEQIVSFHDYELDCGADTADEAMIKLAELVLKKYGDY